MRGDEKDYNFFFTDTYAVNNLDRHADTYQSPEAAGEGYLLKAPDHGNTSIQYFPLFGENNGVIPNLRWNTVDGPPTGQATGTNYIGRTFDAALGTSAAAPFIIPAAGASGQISFSVTIKTLEPVTNQRDVANALAAALSGTTDLPSIGLPAFQLISTDIVPIMSVDQGYENFQTFYDQDMIGKLVMSVARKTGGFTSDPFPDDSGPAVNRGAALDTEPEYQQGDGAPIGYVLLNKADVQFMFEQHWDLDLYAGETENTREYGSGAPGKVAEVRLGIKDISNIEFATCMRRLDTRSLKKTFPSGTGNNPGVHSRIPMMANGQFDVYDNSPWFILKDSLLTQPSFSLQQYQSSLPSAPNGPSSGDSLKKYLLNTDDGEYAYLADDVNFTLFRYVDEEIKDVSANVKQLSWPECSLRVTNAVDYLGGIDYIAQGLDGPTDFKAFFDNSLQQEVNGLPVNSGRADAYVEMADRPYKSGAYYSNTFPVTHSIFPSENFRFACGGYLLAKSTPICSDLSLTGTLL